MMIRRSCMALVLLLLVACGGQAGSTPVATSLGEATAAAPAGPTTPTSPTSTATDVLNTATIEAASPASPEASMAATSGATPTVVTAPGAILDPNDATTEALPAGVRVETIAGAEQGVAFPVAIAFLPDGRWLVTEKGSGEANDAQIHLFEPGQQQPRTFATIRVDSFFERGLLGITADPQFNDNHYVYVFYSRPGDPVVNTVVRYTERDGVGVDPTVLFEAPVLTGAGNHNGGNVHFGPDGKLYVSVGENARPAYSRDPQALYGKIHRINPDGSVPADNPFAPAPGWAYGLRNPFDFTFDPLTGNLWTTENGPSCDDELNLIRKGQDYGWGPGNRCSQVPEGSVAPALRWSDPVAVTGVAVYTDDAIAAWQGSMLICANNNGALYRSTLTPDRTAIADVKRVELPEDIGCRTDVEMAPDGSIYIADPPNIHRIVAGS